MSVAECSIHLWREGFPDEEILSRVDYIRAQDVASADPGFMNVVSSTPRVPI